MIVSVFVKYNYYNIINNKYKTNLIINAITSSSLEILNNPFGMCRSQRIKPVFNKTKIKTTHN